MAGAERERHQLDEIDRHAHRLGGERILALRAPGASRTRVVDEVQGDVDDHEDRDRDVEVGEREGALVLHDQVVTEEVQRIDVEDAVGAAREVVAEDLVAVRGEREEDLEEEERDDGEVVTAQPARRQPDQEAAGRPDDDHERDDDERGRVDAELVRAEHRVRVRADAVEGHEAEVEQAAPADDDVETERQQHVEHRVERDAVHVGAVRDGRHERERRRRRARASPTRALGAGAR